MANVASARHGYSVGGVNGAGTQNGYDSHGSVTEENQLLGRGASITSNTRSNTTQNWRGPAPVTPTRKDLSNSADKYPPTRANGSTADLSDEDIPENMYRPDKDDPEGWIHRDKLAKIESEELQAAGINLASARTRSQSKLKSIRDPSRDGETKREEKRQRLQSPAEIEDEVDRANWDFRLPDEIEDDNAAAAAQMYSNPVLRKSGSKIPIMTSSPLPIPAERYERDTPIARKRTASGTMSLEGDLNIAKARNTPSSKSPDDDDTTSSAVASSKPSSPQKPRSKSATVSPTPVVVAKKTVASTRKVSAPPRATPSPSQRPGTRSGEQDRPRTVVNKPEGDPPWLATMYKPDPRLPPDQQLIPTLAKKQMQAQWAAEGAVPKTYDREFTPVAVHHDDDLNKDALRNMRTPSPIKKDTQEERTTDSNSWNLQPGNSIKSNNGRPGTSGSVTGGYSTMPKVVSPREASVTSPKLGSGSNPAITGRSTNMPPPPRMQAQSLAMEDDEKVKKGCACCIVM